MIWKATYTFLVLIFIHAGLTKFLPSSIGLTQWQENKIIAQKFVYDNQGAAENVILGSSLSTRIILDSLTNFYNLSLGGMNSMDGLNVLTYYNRIPKRIIIEINFIDRAISPSIFNSEFSYQILKYFPVLREENQPVLKLFGLLLAIKGVARKENLSKPLSEVSTDENSIENSSLFSQLLNLRLTEFHQKPYFDLSNHLTAMKKILAYFEKNGTIIAFFEMPVNKMIRNSPKAILIRNYINYYFPDSLYQFIKIPNDQEYYTGDGVHLMPQSAIKYTSYFKEQTAHWNKFLKNRR